MWSHPRGSNSGPRFYEKRALPTELGWRIKGAVPHKQHLRHRWVITHSLHEGYLQVNAPYSLQNKEPKT